MNDIESIVVDKLSRVIDSRFADLNIDVTSVYVPEPSRFPHVSIVQTDSYTNQNTYECERPEFSSIVTFQINVYSNLSAGKKSQAKMIISVLDFVMQSLGFVRTSLTPVPNYLDSTVYRITSNYRAYVTHDNQIYRR